MLGIALAPHRQEVGQLEPPEDATLLGRDSGDGHAAAAANGSVFFSGWIIWHLLVGSPPAPS
eukprot:2800712-Pyramimonas_sp.AAC.1